MSSELGMVGLGRMGAGIVRRLLRDGHRCVGYDLSADVTPQEAARIDFVANAAGVYEVELEGAGELLFELEIVP